MDPPTRRWWTIGTMFAVPPDIPRTIFAGFGCRRMRSPALLWLLQRRTWPLCHNAHVRPTFGLPTGSNMSWSTSGSRKRWSKRPRPMIPSSWCRIITCAAAQDGAGKAAQRDHHHVLAYSLAQLESYGICPWRQEILEDSLAAASSGFTRARQPFSVLYRSHLEARIDRDSSTVSYGGR